MISYASRVVARRGEGEDRVKINLSGAERISAVLADGAGGIAGGGSAADLVVSRLVLQHTTDFGFLFDSILEVDNLLQSDPSCGLTTVACVHTNGLEFIGGVVGDSDVLLYRAGELENLAPQKEFKPLLGDGNAFPTVFAGSLDHALLLLVSDGLTKYISSSDVLEICSNLADPEKIINELINSLELPNGQLQDDVSVVAIMSS